MVFAIEEINQASSLLPNITLGFRIFDSCQMVSRALLGTMQFLTGHQKVVPNFHCHHISPEAGLIAEAGITESRAIASLLGLYRYPQDCHTEKETGLFSAAPEGRTRSNAICIPVFICEKLKGMQLNDFSPSFGAQISYFATGPVTNERSQFPSFFRTIPSNKFQALGLARLVIHFGWTWVGLLATDSEYGEQGIQIVQEEIIKKKVCVAFLSLLPLLLDMLRVRNIANTITASQARVIVTFCGLEVQPLFIQLYQQRVEGRVWLCSEAMSQISVFRNPKDMLMLNGSLSISSHKEPVPGLRDFILQLHPTTSSEDIFIQEFWSKVFNCRWNQSSVEEVHGSRYCTGKENLNDINSFVNMPGFGLAFNVHNAVYAIAHALHDMMAQEDPRRPKAQMGPRGFSPWKVFQYLRKVRFKNKVGEEVSFDEHGDPPALFDIHNTHLSSSNGFRLVQVGQLSPSQTKKLAISDSIIMWTGGRTEIPISVCTPSCPMGYHKSHCSDRPTCCFDCVPCARGEIANQTDSAICSSCPEGQWPDKGQTKCLPKKELFLPFHEPLGVILASTSVCGSLLPVVILTLFIAHRETPLVRANSCELSYLLLFGLALSSLCCLLFLGQPTHRACLLRQVAFGMTFALCLSCILAKTLLVVAAFRAIRPGGLSRVWLNSRMSYAVILLGCLIQLLLCTTWFVVSPPSLKRDPHTLSNAITLSCDEGSPTAFWGMLAYLGLLAGLSLTGAFLARNLPEAFNEASLICFSLLGCFGVWLAFVPAYLTSRGRYAAATEAFAILASSLALLSGMFLPKCYILLFCPQLNNRRFLMRSEKHLTFKSL
ncbi:extracellular calcium-sensing receptor-like [Sceloporus undulatus]|uniref:extracellular calcium-sensing receptor-like n=1 Tax=Sceloporus undulatus TaxID=8520 RepID=UPI001C4CD33E|nr:extracellular calcium-sensing receptor-like [Sceloporus undulatus]